LERLRHIATLHEEDRALRTKAEHDRIEGVLDGLSMKADHLSRERDELSDVTHAMEKQIGHMEEERNYYKEECLKLQEMLKKRVYVSDLYIIARKINRCLRLSIQLKGCLCVGEPCF
jgi:hypothetical protein